MAASSIATRSGAGMLTVASVFKSGGSYFPKYVRVLRDAVRRNLTIPHRFVCLTDVDVPCERIPLIHGWPSFYSKIELFRPGLFDGPVLYLDLDTVVHGNIDDMARVAATVGFAAVTDPWFGHFNSSIMAWTMDCTFLYERFRADAARFQRIHRKGGASYGDQGFTEATLRAAGVRFEYVDRLLPGLVCNYFHVGETGKVPDGSGICMMMTRPKPHEVEDWVVEHWR